MLYFTGDTHHSIDIDKIESFTPLPNSKLIVLGDWGGLWYNDYQKNYPVLKKWCKWQHSKKFSLFALPGNHENYNLINALPVTELKDQNNSIKVKLLRTDTFDNIHNCDIYILQNGVHIIENKKILAIRGALSVDKKYRTKNADWWENEILSAEEKNQIVSALEKNDKFDFIISHTAPAFIVKKLIQEFNVNPDKIDSVSIFLEKIHNKYLKNNFKYWLFGHFHLNWKYQNFICLYNKIIDEKISK